MKKLIEIKNVVKAFGNQVVLKGITLDIYENEFVTLLGPSGCGKTTLLRMLAGFIEPSQGQIIIDGQDQSNVPAYKRDVNTVFQHYALFPHLDVYQNIAFGLNIKKMPKDIIDQKVSRMISLVGLEGFEHRDVTLMSGGQQQRVAIARALAPDPEIIYFDEPTSALDPELIGEVLNVMKDLAREGRTMIVVTHEMSFARDVSNHTIFMENGVICEEGESKKFFRNPKKERTREFLRLEEKI